MSLTSDEVYGRCEVHTTATVEVTSLWDVAKFRRNMLFPSSGYGSINVILMWSEGGRNTGTLSEPLGIFRGTQCLVLPNNAKKQI
jgi:hypothetical protein